jgi:hypothetical protein
MSFNRRQNYRHRVAALMHKFDESLNELFHSCFKGESDAPYGMIGIVTEMKSKKRSFVIIANGSVAFRIRAWSFT